MTPSDSSNAISLSSNVISLAMESEFSSLGQDNILYNRKEYILPLQIKMGKNIELFERCRSFNTGFQKNLCKTIKIHRKQNKL